MFVNHAETTDQILLKGDWEVMGPNVDGISTTSPRRRGDLRRFQHKSCVPAYACGSPHSTPGKMALATWPPGSRRMLCDGAPVRNDVGTIYRRAAHLDTHIRSDVVVVIDSTLAATRHGCRRETRVQQVISCQKLDK
ncbi:hypothetical protein SFRURICE_018028 [Spodoptera frugiperda]|nr:hypothetical protein SFRURICE_018028 [Spodoptera frugiperda]